MTLKSELGMRKDFKNNAQEALLGIYYTASQARKKAGEFFRLHGLTDVQFNVLSLLQHQSGEKAGLTQVELSRMMLVNRANITTLIDRMEKAKLVVRQPAPDDRRYNVVVLTPLGTQRFSDAEDIYMGKVSEIMSTLGDSELETLVAFLEKVRVNLDRVEID